MNVGDGMWRLMLHVLFALPIKTKQQEKNE